MVKGVIFDMDGTMFDTERMSTITWQKVGEELGIDIPIEFIDRCRGKSSAKIGELFQHRYGNTFDYEYARRIKHRFFDEMVEKDGVPVKKGLIELLEYLKNAKIPAAVATSNGREWSEKLLKLTGTYDYFTAFMYGDMMKVSKPEPDIFLKAAKKLGQRPQDCLVLEDSTPGILAGKAAGGYVIYVPDMIEVSTEVKAGITAEMENLSYVIDWIKIENE